MRPEGDGEMDGATTTSVLLFIGYSLYKTVMLDSYITDFGLVDDSIGYVSNLTFMLAASLGIAIAAVLILIGRSDPRRSCPPPSSLAVAVMICGYLVGFFVEEPPAVILFVLGTGWGFASTIITVSFVELFAREESSVLVILQLASGSLFSAALILALKGTPTGIALFTHILLLAACLVSLAVVRKSFGMANLPSLLSNDKSVAKRELESNRLDESSAQAESRRLASNAFKEALMPITAYILFEMVVGLVNMYAYESDSSFVIASSGPMWGMLICAALLVGFVVFSNRVPNSDMMSLMVFPFAIGVLLLLPFLGGVAAGRLSVLLYAAYIFTSTYSMFCYITVCRKTGADVCRVSAVVQLLARITLLAGLGLGRMFALIPDGEPVMRSGMMTAVCVYLLLVVIVYWGFRNARHKKAEVAVEVRYIPESFEDATRSRLEQLANRYGLSGRECDVYASLLRGGTAKSIAEQLGLSPYTVQGHIQKIYAKLGVNKKEQAIELFNCLEDESD